MPAEPTRAEGLGRKITVFRKPSGIPNPATHELVHFDHVHGQTSWRAEKAFDKPWKSSYNFSTRLFTLSFLPTIAFSGFSAMKGAYDAPSIIRAYSSGFCSRPRIRKTRATVHVYTWSEYVFTVHECGGTNEKYTPVIFLERNIFDQFLVLSSRLKITWIGRLNFGKSVNQLMLILI